MEKENTESLNAVSIKPDYPPSEYSSEPPPAYHKPRSSAVQVAKIVAVTVVLVSFIFGSFWLASAYVTANASCKQLEQELELLSEVADRFDTNPLPQRPEALIRENPDKNSDDSEVVASSNNEIKIEKPKLENIEDKSKIQFNVPSEISDWAKNWAEKNQKSRMNCVVEKKKAEEVVDHQPKTVRLPFGVNLTTDPRFERISGERMVIVCESGNIQSAEPSQTASEPRPVKEVDDNNIDSTSDEEDGDNDTIMIQPIMIPIPHTAFQTHMPQQQAPYVPQAIYQPQQNYPQQIYASQSSQVPQQIYASHSQMPQQIYAPQHQMHPMEAMRPPMPPMRPPMEAMRPPMEPVRPPMRAPVEFTRPAPMAIVRQVQIQVQPQNDDDDVEAPKQPQQDNMPNPLIQHIIQQIITQKIMESQQRAQEAAVAQKQAQQNQFDRRPIPADEMANVPRRLPIPEEILTQLNRLPNTDRVIVAVAQPDSSSGSSSEEDDDDDSSTSSESDEDKQRQSMTVFGQMIPDAIRNRQMYGRGMAAVNIPVPIMQEHSRVQEDQQHDQEPQAAASTEEQVFHKDQVNNGFVHPKQE